MKKTFLMLCLVLVSGLILGGCTTADMVSSNLSTDADYFRVNRRIVFYNGITGEYILSIEGFCSLDVDMDGDLNVTCKTGEDSYKKHFLGLSDNVTYFAEQIESKDVSPDHYKVVFKPSAIIPEIEIR